MAEIDYWIFEQVQKSYPESLYSPGHTELKRFKQGKKLSLEDTIKAHCYDCNGQSASDCGIDYCSMYPYMPFKRA